MKTSPDTKLSSDEKLMGAVAHLFGPLAAIIVWGTQKDKSRFVKFQALQALAFDLVLAMVMGVVFFCLFGIMFAGISVSMLDIPGAASTPNTAMPFFMLPFMFPFLTFACIFPFSLLILAIRLVASISILNGRNYQYPILGKWLENFYTE